MTPLRGIGANVALRDAGLLCRNLTIARRGERTVLQAVRDYETAMVEYGFAAVRSSRRALDGAVADKPVALAMMKGAFRLLNAAPPLKRRVFKGFGDD